MSENVKEKITRIGAQLIHCKGFNNTGLQEILQAAEVPKGSFYFYFKNKEDFGLHVIEYFRNHFRKMSASIINDPLLPPLQKIRKILDSFIQLFTSQSYTCGCPIGNLSQEMGDLSDPFRNALKEAIDDMIKLYGGLLRQAQAEKEISTSFDVEKLASFLVFSWHGALVHMKVEKDSGPLERHADFILDYIQK